MHNFTYISQHLFEWGLQGYVTALGFLFWPLFFSAIIGYVYIKQQSLTAVAAVVLIIFAAFGNSLLGVGPWVNFLYIAISAVVAGLVLMLFVRRRVG